MLFAQTQPSDARFTDRLYKKQDGSMTEQIKPLLKSFYAELYLKNILRYPTAGSSIRLLSLLQNLVQTLQSIPNIVWFSVPSGGERIQLSLVRYTRILPRLFEDRLEKSMN